MLQAHLGKNINEKNMMKTLISFKTMECKAAMQRTGETNEKSGKWCPANGVPQITSVESLRVACLRPGLVTTHCKNVTIFFLTNAGEHKVHPSSIIRPRDSVLVSC
jgi:hypothetical protein